MEEIYDIKTPRRSFSVSGFAISAVLIVGALLQLAFIYLPPVIWGEDNWLSTSSAGFWLMTFIPVHGVAIPMGVYILSRLPESAPQKSDKGLRWLLPWIPVCFFLMYSGSIIGNIFSGVASGGMAENALLNFAMDSHPLKILVMVILAPCLEELLFRKALIDHTVKYGEKWAVVLSGLLFGLFHTNFFQFFYAFFLGVLFAYIYVRTGRFSFVAILHCVINFVGSVMAPWILGLLDLEALESVSGAMASGEIAESAEEMLGFLQDNLLGLAVYMLFTCFIISMFIWGLVLFIIKVRRLEWHSVEAQLPRGQGFKTVYLNVGIMLFIIMSLVMSVVMLFLK